MTELFCETELAARKLLANRRAASTDATTSEIIVLNVFTAMWSASLTKESVEDIGRAMHHLLEKPDVSAALAALVRAKVLRTRMSVGRKFYELAY